MLSHDYELMVIRLTTKIKCQQDFDFYLKWLFKCSSWMISVIDYYNREVFGTSSEPRASAVLPFISHFHGWEDDSLQQLDSEAPTLAPLPLAPTLVPPPAPAPALSVFALSLPQISSQLTYVSAPITGNHANVVSNYHFTATSISHGAAASDTIDTQLQVDISQLSLKESTDPSTSKGCRVSAAAHKCHTTTQKLEA